MGLFDVLDSTLEDESVGQVLLARGTHWERVPTRTWLATVFKLVTILVRLSRSLVLRSYCLVIVVISIGFPRLIRVNV